MISKNSLRKNDNNSTLLYVCTNKLYYSNYIRKTLSINDRTYYLYSPQLSSTILVRVAKKTFYLF